MREGTRQAGVFITGTDTEVGKTYVSLALLQALRDCGINAAAMKPVATGAVPTADGLRNSDAQQLQAAAGFAAAYERVNPYCFEPAIAPHLAAEEAGIEIELNRICDSATGLAGCSEFLLVEGIGGWRVPLGAGTRVSDLAVKLGLPVVLVVGMRLGCINHTLLTWEAIRSDPVVFAGWIANCLDPGYASTAPTIRSLTGELGLPPLAVFGSAIDLTAPNPRRAAQEVLAVLRNKSLKRQRRDRDQKKSDPVTRI